MNWNELGRNYRCFRQQGIEVSIYDLLDCPTDEEQVTLLTLLYYSNIIRNMSLHDTRRTNFVLSELLILCYCKYLHTGKVSDPESLLLYVGFDIPG